MNAEASPWTLRRALLVLGVVLFLGLLLKMPCTSGDWRDGRPFLKFCYTDLLPLYQDRLDEGAFPYLQEPNEYPVGLGLFMWVTAAAVRTDVEFFLLNVLLLSGAAVWTTALLYRMAGAKAAYFAAAPTVLLYAFLNWDLIPVLLATAATLAFLRQRDGPAGALLGAGAATKLYPGLFVLPFSLDRERQGRRTEGVRLVITAAAVWLVANVPIAALNFENWSLFFRFNAARLVDWGTLWFVGCHRITGEIECPGTGIVNTLSAVTFVVGAVLLWRLKTQREPDFPRWTFGLPLVVLFLLTTKVYSPQYSLWLLPWFALVAPNVRLFLAFEAADVAVFFTEFSWLGRKFGYGGLPVGPMELAVVARAAVLVVILVLYVRERAPDLLVGGEQRRAVAT
jgi:uncharacterized membrane protein